MGAASSSAGNVPAPQLVECDSEKSERRQTATKLQHQQQRQPAAATTTTTKIEPQQPKRKVHILTMADCNN
eukprot:4965887-Amphidinium_carterae.1